MDPSGSIDARCIDFGWLRIYRPANLAQHRIQTLHVLDAGESQSHSRAGLLASGSSDVAGLPSRVASGMVCVSSPVTATGSHRIHTGFPQPLSSTNLLSNDQTSGFGDCLGMCCTTRSCDSPEVTLDDDVDDPVSPRVEALQATAREETPPKSPNRVHRRRVGWILFAAKIGSPKLRESIQDLSHRGGVARAEEVHVNQQRVELAKRHALVRTRSQGPCLCVRREHFF